MAFKQVIEIAPKQLRALVLLMLILLLVPTGLLVRLLWEEQRYLREEVADEMRSLYHAHPGRALSREQIMNSVWGYGCAVTHRSIDRFVTSLRKKIEHEPENPVHILTVRNFGYRFMGDGQE